MSAKLCDAWGFYCQHKLPSLKGGKTDFSRWTRHIAPHPIHLKSLCQIKILDILQLKKQLEAKNLSPQTVLHCLSLLRRVLHKAIHLELYPGPVPFFEMPKFNNKRNRFLKQKEAVLLLKELAPVPLWHDIAVFALNTGMRSGEIFKVQKEHIQFLESGAFVHVPDSKTTASRYIPLTEQALDVVKQRLGSSPTTLLFPSATGKQLKQVQRPFRRAVEATGLNDGVTNRLNKVVFHTLRHTFASWLMQNDVPLAVISDLLGHSTPKLTMRYAHLDKERLLQAVNLLW